jgi:DNA-binding MarR family transcriptional regulator
MAAYPVISTQVIGQAESALGAILDPILAATQTSFPQWLVLTVTAGSGGTLERDQLVGRITNARKLDAADVLTAIRELTEAGLLAGTQQVSLTDAGRARYQQIRGRIEDVTGRLFGDLPASDLETAGRVLSIVTARANAELSGSTR